MAAERERKRNGSGEGEGMAAKKHVSSTVRCGNMQAKVTSIEQTLRLTATSRATYINWRDGLPEKSKPVTVAVAVSTFTLVRWGVH
jgi:hypothetical protein